jgi:tRNA A37 threonylcarbamoyladenosine dehydratase
MTITVLTSNCVRISFDQLYKRIDGELCKVPPRANYNIMKVNKYDRQIRLWGQNGQRRLGEAKVALLGASGAGIEALKNLVLPGVGNI